MKRLIASLVFLAATLASDGQTAVKSLDSCVKYALSHNCDILLGKSAEAQSREDLRQSKLDLLPSLNLYVNQYYNWGRSVDMQELVIVRNRLTRQTSGSVGASLPLFDGLQRINTIAMNRHRAAAAAKNVLQKTLDESNVKTIIHVDRCCKPFSERMSADTFKAEVFTNNGELFLHCSCSQREHQFIASNAIA